MKQMPSDIRTYVLERDKHRCRICSKPASEVHHIYPRNTHIPDFLAVPPTVSNHHPDNLLSVCHECHLKIHNGQIKLNRADLIRENQERRNVFPIPEHVQRVLNTLKRGKRFRKPRRKSRKGRRKK